MICPIRLEAAGEAAPAPSDGSTALQPSRRPFLTLRFRISAPDAAGLEALRYARRSMLREEWTLGRDPEEPSLESAIFSAAGITWTVPLSQRSRCLERLAELEARANRALQALPQH